MALLKCARSACGWTGEHVDATAISAQNISDYMEAGDIYCPWVCPRCGRSVAFVNPADFAPWGETQRLEERLCKIAAAIPFRHTLDGASRQLIDARGRLVRYALTRLDGNRYDPVYSNYGRSQGEKELAQDIMLFTQLPDKVVEQVPRPKLGYDLKLLHDMARLLSDVVQQMPSNQSAAINSRYRSLLEEMKTITDVDFY